MNQEKFKQLREKFSFMSVNYISCDDGWYDLIHQICEDIAAVGYPENFAVAQVKEKFGGLRFYVDYSTDRIDKIISNAEARSFQICEVCGSTEGVLRGGGWIKTLCEEHAKDKDGNTKLTITEIQKRI